MTQMTATGRVVARGADRFRRPSALERIADWVARVPIAPSVRRVLKKLYWLALTWQTRGRGLVRMLPGGETIRVLPQYSYLSWNPDEYRAFRDVVRPGMVALDIGANVGAYSTLLGRWVGSSGIVFAFEPALTAFEGLTRHVELNHLSGIVKPIRAALSDRAATARFLLADSAGESRLAGDTEDGHRRAIPVTSLTIDEVCRREGVAPDFIKIDVEGSELAVLRGARETIRARRGRLAVFVELHPTIWPRLGVSRDDVLGELRALSLAPEILKPVADLWAIDGMCVRLREI